MATEFEALGNSDAMFAGLETFAAPAGVGLVELESDEVSALCPITAQPDWYRVQIAYTPRQRCIESKSLKLYLQGFRNEGIFGEAFAVRIADDLSDVLACPVDVTVIQKARGGITIRASARRGD
jgi:7-cyano-7-deazaguanine reductase